MWIELADIALKNRRKPDAAILIGDQPVWPGIRRFQRELLKLPCLQVQASKLVGHLFGHPKGIVGAHGGIMGRACGVGMSYSLISICKELVAAGSAIVNSRAARA